MRKYQALIALLITLGIAGLATSVYADVIDTPGRLHRTGGLLSAEDDNTTECAEAFCMSVDPTYIIAHATEACLPNTGGTGSGTYQLTNVNVTANFSLASLSGISGTSFLCPLPGGRIGTKTCSLLGLPLQLTCTTCA